MKLTSFENLSEESRMALTEAVSIADEFGHTVLMCVHMLLALLKLEVGNAPVILRTLLLQQQTDPLESELETKIYLRELTSRENQRLKSEFSVPVGQRQIAISLPLLRSLQHAKEEAARDHTAIGTDYILLGIASIDSKAREVLIGNRINEHRVRDVLNQIAAGEKKALAGSLIDLSILAFENRLPRYFLRKELLQRINQVLKRTIRNSILLVGEPGTGRKTLFRSWVAQFYPNDNNNLPRVLEVRRNSLLTNPTAVIQTALQAVPREDNRLILLLPQFQTVWTDKEAMAALQSTISTGKTQFIGVISPSAFRKIETDALLTTQFEVLYVDATDKNETLSILKLHYKKLEEQYNVKVLPSSLPIVSELASQLGSTPESAILLLDTACAQVASIESLKPELRPEGILPDRQVDPVDIVAVVSQVTEIPLAGMPISDTERKALLQMEKRLHQRIIGQNDAVNAIASAYRRARAGLKDPKRPIGSFLCIGPTGVGKTELAKAVAQFIFGNGGGENFTRLDMSEYLERHNVARMTGAPPGYVGYEEGGQLTEAVRKNPHQVILFDEIEKAHPDVLDALLQILDDGRMTDGQGRVVDFRNVIVIMSSNVGTHLIPIQYTDATHERQVHEALEQELRRTFKPEFLNRIDEIIFFKHLTESELLQILEIQLKIAVARIKKIWHINIKIPNAVKKWLLSRRKGRDLAFGARPLKRIIQKYFEGPLSKALLGAKFTDGDQLMAEVKWRKIRFNKVEEEQK